MAVQLTPLGKAVVGTLKWVAVPALAGLIGMKVIAPNLGGPPPKPIEHKRPTAPISENGRKFQEIRDAAN